MPISRMQQPRQMYGLGSFVKKAVKGVTGAIKSVAKSDLGKAALLYAGTAGLGSIGAGGGLGSLLRGSTYLPSNVMANLGTSLFGAPSIAGDITSIGGSKGLLGTLGITPGFGTKGFAGTAGMIKGGIGAATLAGLLTPKAEEDVQALRSSGDQGLLKAYLERYYKNLNPDAEPETVASFVRANAAYGGRMGYAEKGNVSLEDLPRGLQIDTTTSMYGAAVPEGTPVMEEESLNENLEFLNKAKEGMSPSSRIYILKEYLDKALQRGEITQEKYQEMLMPFFGAMGEKVTEQIKEYENFANGGRIGYAFGTPEDNAIQASGIMNLPLNQNPAGVTELDLRDSGGFIPPVGVKEKADDIPAMLSNNEFVFTADAVKGMGDGDVNKGAQRMYDMMKKLENGGRV
jgi:hypothetical protein